MTSHLHRIRLLAGTGIGLALSGPVLALAGHGAAARDIALAGAGLLLWERAALALTRWWTARPIPTDLPAPPQGPAARGRG
ncbi:hypothetical protein [Streptomyces tremellae]|uniref:Uncharacterized protein n=1 Tax=Streptomyces tremellae TaxID=1124239 RepID=A0ABP7E4T5_9ACTN